jgi:glycine betaine/proline transport system ATP-binding protein
MDTEAQEYHLQYGDGRRLNVISWSGEDPIESLASLPVCVNANTKMYDVMALRYQTGHGVLVADNQGKVLGYIGDRDIYHAMLGKLIADD